MIKTSRQNYTPLFHYIDKDGSILWRGVARPNAGPVDIPANDMKILMCRFRPKERSEALGEVDYLGTPHQLLLTNGIKK